MTPERIASDHGDDDLTLTLNRLAAGDRHAAERAWAYFQADVRRLAEQSVREWPRVPDLQATVIINEVWVRLFGRSMEDAIAGDDLAADEDPGADEPVWANRGHFWGAIHRTVERYLVDEHRRATARKRGGGWKRLPLEVAVGELANYDRVVDGDIPALFAALRHLEDTAPLTAAVVRHRYLIGMTVRQTATCLGIAPRTVDNHWKFGRTRLRQHLAAHDAGEAGGGPLTV